MVGSAPMRPDHRRYSVASVIVLVCWCGLTIRAQAPDDKADVQRLVEILQLRAGSVVADIGAGSGTLSVQIASRVGATGRVFSTDIERQRLVEIREAAT